MSYLKWFNTHAQKHKNIVDRLVKQGLTNEQIVDYFEYDNMVKKELEFCPLYKKNKKCHDMENLNCYLCACPNFRFDDDGLSSDNELKVVSRCDIGNGEKLESREVIHQDCSSCQVPHLKEYVVQNFSLDWREIMRNCK